MDTGYIRPFRFWTQHILPLVYDDSLSYLEVLYKVKIKLNEVIDWANGFTDELYQYIDQKTQENLEIMKKEMEDYKTLVNGQLTTIQDNIDDVNSRLDGIITEINQIINNFQTEINQSFDDFKNDITQQLKEQDDKVTAQLLAQNLYVQTQIALINSKLEENKQWNKKYTDDEIKKVIKLIPDLTELMVSSPVTGKIGTVQVALDDLFNLYLKLGEPITAQEYDDLNLTAEEYDNKQLTAYMYDYYGKKYLIGSSGGNSEIIYSSTPQLYAKLNDKNVYLVMIDVALQTPSSATTTIDFDTHLTANAIIRANSYVVFANQSGCHSATYLYSNSEFLRSWVEIKNGNIHIFFNRINSLNPKAGNTLRTFIEFMED